MLQDLVPDARAPDLTEAQPRYAALAAVLAAEIEDGRRPVGTMLPAEAELSQTFGVSRATVREALRRLRSLGLVEAFRGVGTRVIACRPRSNYVLAMRSVTDVMGYAGPTRLDIAGRATVEANAALATRLGCDAGSLWRHVAGVRRAEPTGQAISCVDLYIAIAFQDIADSAELIHTPAYRQIPQLRGIPVAEIRQDIAAVSLDAAQAASLGSAAGRPGLFIRRRFYAGDGTLLEATLNIHADADRFAYALQLGGEGADT